MSTCFLVYHQITERYTGAQSKQKQPILVKTTECHLKKKTREIKRCDTCIEMATAELTR